ncbi:MAG: N-acetyl-gamma-glutamyl-phosphate reductase [Pseudomonadota bacterium]|nr:N-acetyl-gamma-glutamyl-phosphate reductase [Pseudomonadota bacterium]|tara:strand:+ start:952 stop:1962 length:1011 start_codon:yes stop_codon:yes gene_type:complete
MKIKAAVLGATGYIGIELVKHLLEHPDVVSITPYSFSSGGKNMSEFDKSFTNIPGKIMNAVEIDFDDYDIVFFACPNGIAMKHYEKFIDKKSKVIDLAADFRLDDPSIWKDFYGEEHYIPEVISKITYGLSEINRENIRNSKIVANPGCYPTAALIPLYPLVREDLIDKNNIIIDAKSGYSGAGRKKLDDGLKNEIEDNFMAYGILCHRHMPEINQELSKMSKDKVEVLFTPHIIPTFRGILETIYLRLVKDVDINDICKIYENYYKDESYIKFTKNKAPNIKDVLKTNICSFSIHKEEENKLILVSCIDNLVKGAAGQAIQNMNLMFNLKESSGL